MGRHRLHPAPRPGRPRHAAAPRRAHRLAAPATLAAAALFVATPTVAFADDEDPAPPAALDGLATAGGDALGTDTPDDESADSDESDSDETGDDESETGDGDEAGDGGTDGGAPVSGAGIVGDTGLLGGAPGLPGLDDVTALPAVDTVGGAAAGALGAEAGTTLVDLTERNGSGISGEATIDPESVVATASGMDPTQRYVSFFYGATSSATNNNPCILDGTNPLPADQTIGEWEVDADGNGTLSAANPLGARYALQAGTMSIRQVQHDFSTATALPVNPLSYSLVACGEVQRIEALDPVTNLVPRLPSLPSVPPLS